MEMQEPSPENVGRGTQDKRVGPSSCVVELWGAVPSGRCAPGVLPNPPIHIQERRKDRTKNASGPCFVGGAEGIRTPGLLIANETRYQLRHSPLMRTKQ